MNDKAIQFGGMYPERFWEFWWSPDWTIEEVEKKSTQGGINRPISLLTNTEMARLSMHKPQEDGTYRGCLGDIRDRFFQDKKQTNNVISISEENL